MEWLWPASLGDWLGWIGLFLAIAFGLLSVYFYKRQQRFRQFGFVVQQEVIQTNSHPEVTIHFRGEQITNLIRVRIAFLSIGAMAVKKSDIPSSSRPRIVSATAFLSIDKTAKQNADLPSSSSPRIVSDERCRILSVAKLAVSNSATDFTITLVDQEYVKIEFEYLNRGDGAVIELLLEGSGDLEMVKVMPFAEIIDGEESVYQRFRKQPSIAIKTLGIVTLLFGFVSFGLLGSSAAGDIFSLVSGNFRPRLLINVFIVLPLCGLLVFMAMKAMELGSKRFPIPRFVEDAMAANEVESKTPKITA